MPKMFEKSKKCAMVLEMPKIKYIYTRMYVLMYTQRRAQ